jgi:SAM-dependent methyltransferase
MVYPKLKSSYSEMAPKILGSYEAELFPWLEEIFNKPYRQILDIGCAEGFYAVGMAIRFADAEIYAFDINPNALQMCKEMAEINRVAERVHLRTTCTNETLRNFDFQKKSLLICDCEGYELELFTEESIDNLRNCDLLIELHDILGFSVKEHLVPLFEKTHNVELIESRDRNPDEYPELEGLRKRDKKVILSECRDGLFGRARMHWAYISSKTSVFTKTVWL